MDKNKIKILYFHIKGKPNEEDLEKFALGSRANYIRAEVYYDIGHWSFATYRNIPRGYYMSVSKVTRGKDWESFSFSDTGYYATIQEVKRRSKKADENALSVFEKEIHNYIKECFPDLEIEAAA